MVDARYDGLAEWYDDYLKQPLYDDVPEHVCRLVGSGTGLCIDVRLWNWDASWHTGVTRMDRSRN